jgi:hypothetical protein
MTALERLERLKIPKVQCITCVYAVELKTTLACKRSGKLLVPRYPKLKCLHYKKIKE